MTDVRPRIPLDLPEITSAAFPVPGRVMHTNDPTLLQGIYAFAGHQAAIAGEFAGWLADYLTRVHHRDVRTGALSVVLRDATQWRYRFARDNDDPRGRASCAERYRALITNDNANYDRLGVTGRVCDGAVWDPHEQVFHGGLITPAFETLAYFGRLAHRRFEAEAPSADVLYNPVTLTDGTTVAGNRLARGEAAARIGERLRVRLAERGVHQVETGGDPIYAVTASAEDRRRLRSAALTALTDMVERAESGDHAAATRSWVQAAYLLYQAPPTKKGSDAAIRVALIATGAAVLGRVPRLFHDIDLRAYVVGQSHFTTSLLDHQRR